MTFVAKYSAILCLCSTVLVQVCDPFPLISICLYTLYILQPVVNKDIVIDCKTEKF